MDLTTIKNIQEDINHVIYLLETLGLSINPGKSQVTIFKKGRPIIKPILVINNQTIISSNTIKILEMELNHNLNWDAHFTNLYISL